MSEQVISDLQCHLSELFGEEVSVEVCEERELEGMRISVVQMSYSVRSTGETNQRKHYRQTAVVLVQDDLDLPDFTLEPTPRGIAGKLFSMVGGMGDINFTASPEFSEAYVLQGWIEATVRELFIPEIRNFFSTDPRWSVRGGDERLVIFQKNKMIPESDHDEFVKESLQISALFQLGEEHLDSRPDLRRKTEPDDLVATADQMGGIVGAMLQRQLSKIRITKSELNAFAASSPPRRILPGMSKQVVGEMLPVILIGIVMIGIGIGFAALCWFVGTGNSRYLAFPVSLTAVAGAAIAYFANRHRNAKRRVLRQGKLQKGRITNVTATNTQINNQQQYVVDLEYGSEHDPQKTQCKVYGVVHKKAEELRESEQSVRILIDPRKPNHSICLDLLIVFDDA
ncbi:MAG: hypothetical protein HKN47_17025 [Pirellulaceae bacterium]|nr:hypothetical protein [Pirellulaceae bacterium]